MLNAINTFGSFKEEFLRNNDLKNNFILLLFSGRSLDGAVSVAELLSNGSLCAVLELYLKHNALLCSIPGDSTSIPVKYVKLCDISNTRLGYWHGFHHGTFHILTLGV